MPRKKYMLLAEFPYPSGDLHIGHWYTFAVSDILTRYLRMQGDGEVMYPIGFDAFGLPAENAAIKNDTTPALWTTKNIARMTAQLKSMGASFDWDRLVDTSKPEYYRWTQWIFLKLLEKGLAYRAKTSVNWCPKDKTVLANEQVVNGCCDRCDSEVVQRELEQWMFKTTAFADELVDGLDGLDWTENIKAAQRNWIGRSTGARIVWGLRVQGQKDDTHSVETFTTRPDTLYGATFLVISPEKAKEWLSVGWDAPAAVKNYVSESLRKRELERLEGAAEKTGVATGAFAQNPLSGEWIPVWVADYVLGSYGTGAIMAVPAHDERDHEFAAKFGLPVLEVVQAPSGTVGSRVFEGEGKVVNSGAHGGKLSAQAAQDITDELKTKKVGGAHTTYKLRDWVLSRQRYWGCPIPMVKCPDCGYVPVPERELPIVLPELEDFRPSDDGRSPLAKATTWLKVKCPSCGRAAERETDTMDTFVDSSWYYLRYADPNNKKAFADPKKLREWLPVPMYIGGPEHNTMHLLYARFITKALHSGGWLKFDEPFAARRNHSVILGADGCRMSKSRGNVVDPDAQVAKYGADMGPYTDQTMPWDSNGLTGITRFLKRARALLERETGNRKPETSGSLDRALHAATKKVGEDIAVMHYNTAVSSMMILLNTLESSDASLTKAQRERFLSLLAPMAPLFAQELWSGVHEAGWPAYDATLLTSDTVELPVQVNGKLRATITLAVDAGEVEAVFAARQNANVAKYLEGAAIRKTVYLNGKLLNLVVSPQ
jgi:leucyl-tRNA synthetase